MADELLPRPRFLRLEVDPFSRNDAFFGSDEVVLNPSEVLLTSGHDASLYREMRRTDTTISSAVALRIATASAHGARWFAGKGDEASLYRDVAEGVWGVAMARTVEKEVIAAWAEGFVIHEAVGLRNFIIDGKTCTGPRALKRRPVEGYGFNRREDLVLLANGERPDDRTFRTSVPGHPHALKWMHSKIGTASPYGESVIEDLWISWKRLGIMYDGLLQGLQTQNGILKMTGPPGAAGLSGAGSTGLTTNLSVGDALANAKAMQKIRTAYGILVGVGGMEGEIMDSRDVGDAWIEALEMFQAEARRRILGSELSQAMPSGGRGAMAAAVVHAEAPESFGRDDVDAASQNITRYVSGWVRANFPGVQIDDEELPEWRSNMGTTPTLEAVKALAAGGARVDLGEVASRLKVPLVDEDDTETPLWTVMAPPVVAVASEPDGAEDDDEDEDAGEEL